MKSVAVHLTEVYLYT